MAAVSDITTSKDIDYSEVNNISLDTVPKEYSLQELTDSFSQNDYEAHSVVQNNSSIIDYKENAGANDAKIDVPEYDKVNEVVEYTPMLPSSEETYLPNSFKSLKSVTTHQTTNPITILCSQEPDFMPNMYNVYFILADRNSQIVDIDMSKNIERMSEESGRDYLATPFVNRWSMIGTRIEGIDIPQAKQTVSTIKFAGQTVNKITGKKEYATRVDLTIRLDQSMYILDAFHALNSDFWASERKRKENGEDVYTGKQFFNCLGLAYQNGESKMKYIDVVVEYDADYFTFSRYHDLVGTKGYNTRTGSALMQDLKVPEADNRWLSKKGRVQRYVFHDCHFLGRSSSLNFHQSADAMTATFPFVYKQLGHLTASGQY